MTGVELRLPPHLAGIEHGLPVDAYASHVAPGDLILNDRGGHAGGWWGFIDSVADYRRGREHRFNPDDPHEPVMLHDVDLVRVTVHANWEQGSQPNGATPGRIRVHAYTPSECVTIRRLLRSPP